MPRAIAITYTITDEKGASALLGVHLPSVTNPSYLAEVAVLLAQDVDNIIGGAITSITITQSVALPDGIKTLPAADSDVEEGALFSFKTENNFRARVRVPTFLESLFIAGTRKVDLTDVDVLGFTTRFYDTGFVMPDDAEVWLSDVRGELFWDIVDAVEDFKATRT